MYSYESHEVRVASSHFLPFLYLYNFGFGLILSYQHFHSNIHVHLTCTCCWYLGLSCCRRSSRDSVGADGHFSCSYLLDSCSDSYGMCYNFSLIASSNWLVICFLLIRKTSCSSSCCVESRRTRSLIPVDSSSLTFG